MSLQIKIEGPCEEIVKAQLAKGRARSAQELVERAVAAYSEVPTILFSLGRSQKSPAKAVEDIREIRKSVEVGGVNVRDLVHEGHKY